MEENERQGGATVASATRRRRRPFGRMRGVLTPAQRGATMLALFGLWMCASALMGWAPAPEEEDGRGEVGPIGRAVLSRRLLQEGGGGGGGEGEDGSVYVNEGEPVQLDENGEVELGDNDDPYDKEGNIRKNTCMPPAIKQFPHPLMGKSARRYGGLIVHILLATYMFMGLAIVCDDYFVPALDRIADVLSLDPDVAGATFMAAGSSGPELATAVIGVFVAKSRLDSGDYSWVDVLEDGLVKDDIGVSGVIGSAVFNITLVIAVCALAADRVFVLNWWSVVRDCGCYLVSIVVLLFTIANEVVSWPEALFFLILYVVYCVAMAFNSRIEAFVKSKVRVPESWNVSQAHASGVDGAAAGETSVGNDSAPKQNGGGAGGSTQMSTFGGQQSTMPSWDDPGEGWTEVPMQETQVDAEGNTKKAADPRAPELHAVEPRENPLEKPMDAAPLVLAKFYTLFPLYFLSKYTIPDCRDERWSRFFVATFICAIAWISLYSYVMVWMITVIGFTLGIPDTVMGLTFIAAGVSVPDALSGIAVVKEGHGDMAVSNAIGSNVFDILVCLGVPWFLDTAVVHPGSYVRVRSRGLIYSTFSLFSTIVFLIVASHFNGWRLDRRYGIILLVWYFVFMVFASLYELNVFGEFNPPECDIDV